VELTVDKETKAIIMRGKTTRRALYFETFQTFKTAKELTKHAGFWFTLGSHPKDMYKSFTKEFGASPTACKKQINKAMMNLWVRPVENYTKEFAFRSKNKVCLDTLHKIWEAKDTIEQVKEDGLDNILPFVVYTGCAPKELKRLFGKSAWKKLCKNSKTRNRYIARLMFRNIPMLGKTYVGVLEKSVVRYKYLLDLPSTILKKGRYSFAVDGAEGTYMLKKGYVSIKEACTMFPSYNHARMMHTIRDARRMANQLGAKFSWDWDFDTISRKHEEFSEKITRQKYSKEVFKHTKHYPERKKKISYGDVTAHLLDNAYDIAQEGAEMKHCVASYRYRAAEGRYAVYSIKDNETGKRISTLGLMLKNCGKDGDLIWVYSQHYGPCNSHVERKDANEVVKLVLQNLNDDVTKEAV
jgi:hypothetical protein